MPSLKIKLDIDPLAVEPLTLGTGIVAVNNPACYVNGEVVGLVGTVEKPAGTAAPTAWFTLPEWARPRDTHGELDLPVMAFNADEDTYVPAAAWIQTNGIVAFFDAANRPLSTDADWAVYLGGISFLGPAA